MFRVLSFVVTACCILVVVRAASKEIGLKENNSPSDNSETERIINGQTAEEGQFPWMVALYFRGQFVCTASLVSNNTVLTAAHCCVFEGVKQDAADYYGVIGRVNRSASDATRITFSSVTPHPEYENLVNDIAFFTTAEPVEFSETIQPICVADPNTPIDQYRNATAMGWGRDNRFGGSAPDMLQYAPQAILLHFTCKLRYLGAVTDKQVCADGFGSGICSGDSGGPFVHLGGEVPVEIGVASFIKTFPGCGSFIIGPGVYTRMSAYTDWLLEATNDPNICVA